MELKITKEKVLEAASKCSTAKETLKTLFPEAFENDLKIVNGKVGSRPVFGDPNKASNTAMIEIKCGGPNDNKGFWLSDSYNWEIVKDGSQSILTYKNK